MVTIIVPVYNEEKTVKSLLGKVLLLPLEKQIIVVDDGSTDRTEKILKDINNKEIKVLRHVKNRGKGAAIKTALEHADGEITVIQDADLELDPNDIVGLINPLQDAKTQAVLGIREHYMKAPPNSFFITMLIDLALQIFKLELYILYGCTVGDVMSCYKVITTKIFKELDLKSDGFEIEVEIISKLLRRKFKPLEIPVHYFPRLYNEGKKIKWHDALKVGWAIIKYRFID